MFERFWGDLWEIFWDMFGIFLGDLWEILRRFLGYVWEEILHIIRILGQKKAIPASRGQKLEKTALEKMMFKSEFVFIRICPCFVFLCIGSPGYYDDYDDDGCDDRTQLYSYVY